jgi:dTDP-glucose 4,6-dehydratase
LEEKLRVHGDGSAARDFIYVEDNCEAIDLVLHAPAKKVVGEVFNVGSGQHRSILSIAKDIIDVMCPDDRCTVNMGDRPGQVMRHTADSSKIRDTLGWKPKTEWEEGLRKTIDWYRNNGKWWEKQHWMREIPIMTASGTKELH